jgi:uncharacterized membrane protein YphA (DoxX/SURF4 family)
MQLAFPESVAAVRAVTALVFLSAGIAKARNWSAFEGVVANYRLLPQAAVRPVAYLLPPTEWLLGLAVLFGAAHAEWAAAGLLGVFAVAIAVNLARGRSHIDCGCFNSALKQPLRWSLVARNACMILLLAGVAGSAAPRLDASLLLGTLAGVALFVVVQCSNALLAIPAFRQRHAHSSG